MIVYRPYYNPFRYRRYDPFWDSYYPRTVVVDPIAYQREREYRDGKGEGEEDARKDQPSNSKGHEDYRDSDSMAFREGFVQGYEAELAETTREMREKAGARGGRTPARAVRLTRRPTRSTSKPPAKPTAKRSCEVTTSSTGRRRR